jgi:YhcH/YjgK/YiaL family protein
MVNSTKKPTPDPDWFEKGDWKEGWNILPDESINKEEFIRQYSLNPERWAKAFRFLSGTDLKAADLGRYELENADLFVNISEYTTKNEIDAKFEAHKKYVDIQYLVWGEEQISIVPLSDTHEETPYDEEKDIYFMQSGYDQYYPAASDRFFIFFSEDAHKPCVKWKENALVRKVVVKLRID